MNKLLRRWSDLATLLLVAALVAPLCAQTQADQSQELASVEQLKVEAFKALRGGQFDRTSELLSRAASLSRDPALVQMSDWLHQFQTQRQQLVADRRKGYEKAVEDVQLLLQHGMPEFAADKTAEAYVLSDDKEAFRQQPWVRQMIQRATEMAASAEERGDWLAARALYIELSAIEPAVVAWKTKLNHANRRLRMIAMYVPDEYDAVLDEWLDRREQANRILKPTTQPATRPADDDNESFRTDWREMLRGVRMEMLIDALDDARGNYYREVGHKKLATGGINALRAILTTRGLHKAFTNLADEARCKAFTDALDQCQHLIDRAAPGDEGRVVRLVMRSILASNQNTVQLPEEVLVNEFADGAFGELDAFSTMIWPSDLDEFNKSTQGEFSGVGIQIQLDEDGNLKVVSPLEDSPAYKQGIQAGDIITRINGRSAKGISINQAVKNITGPPNTSVMLTIRSPDGTVRDYTIRRETIKVASIKGYQHLPGGGWDYLVDPQQKIAYLRMTNFTKTTQEELTRALGEIERSGARAVVLDLRNNPGGLLTAATEVCDTFLAGGTIVSTRGERELPSQPAIEAKPSPSDVRLPVVVVVNQFSASASEIVSGALQDQKRALVVGERTFGKGSVQMLFPLAGRSAALKLTTSHYYLPSGRCIHKEDTSATWGVGPDVLVEMTTEQMRTAQQARQEMEVLREKPTTSPANGSAGNLLASDPQLSAAVLLLRLQLAGATL